MMHEHDHSNGYGRSARYEDERHDDEYRSRDHDRGYDDDRAGRYDREASMPFSRREAPRRMLGNTVASVWEVTAQSRTSFDDAIRYGIERARRTLRHIRGAWVQGQEVMIRNNEIYAYRVQLKITYVLDDT